MNDVTLASADVTFASAGGIISVGTPGGIPPVVKANPTEEIIVAGPGPISRPGTGRKISAQGGIVLSRAIDEVVRRFGLLVYELMEYDPTVACATELWKAGVLSDGPRLSPGIRRMPGEIVSERKRQAELDLSTEIKDAADRCFVGLEESLDETLEEMLDAFKFGCTVAEMTYAWGTGQDKDRLMLSSIVPKPRTSWAFEVDPFMRLLWIRGWTGDQWRRIEPEKFAVMTWKPKHRDPRGRSGYRAVYNPWNQKSQIFPSFGEFLHHFADPAIAVTAGKDAKPDFMWVNGRRVERSVVQQVLEAIEAYKSRTGMALPYGSTVETIGGSSDGGAYHNAFDRYDTEIFRGILFSGRPVMNAARNSQADSETSLDLVGMAFQRGRLAASRFVERQILRRWVALNWGAEVAARHTPTVGFGVNRTTEADLINAYANAVQKGLIDESQLPHIWAELGLPDVPPEILQMRSEERKQRIAKAQQDQQDQDGSGDGSGDGSQDKPPARKGGKPVKKAA
jgi:hypothetical protein